jgi:RNA polymerase sigma-70 factor, ECF subfamily
VAEGGGGEQGKRPTLRLVPGGATRARAAEEDALLAAFLMGDDDAFSGLVRCHEGLVLAMVRRYARTPEDARDLSQRTFLRAFAAARRTLQRGRREGVPFRRWLVRIAMNLAKNHLRDEGRWTRVPLEALGPAEAAPPDAVERLARAEDEARVRAAVLRLPRRQREIVTLRIDAELPFGEIAEALGTTENAAKVTFHHAVRRLRELVADGEDRP